MKGKIVKISIIITTLLLFTVTSDKSIIHGILDGLYYSSFIVGIVLFRDKILYTLGLNISCQMLSMAYKLADGKNLTHAFISISANIAILIATLSIYLIVKMYKKKQFKISKPSIPNLIIVLSNLAIIVMGIKQTSSESMLTIAYVIAIPLVTLVTLVMHLSEYYIALIINSLLGLYINYMQIVIGDKPYNYIILNILIIGICLTELIETHRLKKAI